MSQVIKSNKKQAHTHNDGCENCVRQKKQNQALIKVYQRLQEVDRKTNILKKTFIDHKNKVQTNQSFFKSFESKLISLPKMKGSQNKIELNQNSGFEIAANILEKESKSKLLEQQQRLKALLYRMQKQRYEVKPPKDENQSMILKRNIHLSNTSTVSQQVKSFSDNKLQDFKRQTDQMKNLQKSMISQDSFRENVSTQSTSFNTTKLRNSVDLNKYNDLNLWLYETQKHSKLQQQLFITKKIKNRSFSIQKPKVNLPFIRAKK